ncbi:hypothetical protein TNCV_2747171 [Trichonephila clavipes]|nr:hypothetical protein TNCV_2747171 [Trichonephila clavipes]
MTTSVRWLLLAYVDNPAVSYVLTEPKVSSSIHLIGDLDTEHRKRQPLISFRGTIYQTNYQSKAVKPTGRHSSNSHVRHNNYTVRLPIHQLIGTRGHLVTSSPSVRRIFNGTKLELMTRRPLVRHLDH